MNAPCPIPTAVKIKYTLNISQERMVIKAAIRWSQYANEANKEAIVTLLFKNKNGLFPKVVRYLPRIAVDAKNIKPFDTSSLGTILAKEITNNGCNF